MLDSKFTEGDVVVDKFHIPLASYAMSERDYVLRPTATAGPMTVSLPPVALAVGRFYSIIGRDLSMTNTVTIQDLDDSEQWEGDVVLFESGQGQLFYSDGMKWCLRTFADIEIGASTRGSYSKTAAEIHGMTARGGRFRAEARSQDVAILVNADGVHGQGIAYGSLFAQTVNAVYAEAIAKGGSTVTTIRGAMIACDSEGTPTAIGTMYGAHIRVKTSVQPTLYRGLVIEHEKFGAGTLLDEYIKIIDTTFVAGNVVATYGLRMLTTGTITTGISLESPMATGIQVVSALTLATSRAIRSACTLTAGNLGDGYGLNEFDLTAAGVAAGHLAAISSWINVPTGVTVGVGGNFVAAQTNGVWSDAGATITGAVVITGMVTQGIMGTADPTALCIFSSNISGDVLHALFYSPAPVASLGYVVDANTGSSKIGSIPLFTTNGATQYWVRIYDAAT